MADGTSSDHETRDGSAVALVVPVIAHATWRWQWTWSTAGATRSR